MAFLLMMFSLSVSAQIKYKVDSTTVMNLRIDPGNSTGGVASVFFTEVNYILLETTKESLFGSIAKLEVTDDYYIILDYNTHSILFFTKEGKYHTKIKSTEGSTRDFIWDFSVNKFTKQVIFTRDYKTLIYADFNGKEVKTLKMDAETAKDEFNSWQYFFITPDKAVNPNYYNTMDGNDKNLRTYSKSLILYTNENHKVYAHGLGYSKAESHATEEGYISNGLGPITNSGVDTVLFYSKIYDNAIYAITPHGIKFSYKIIFPMYGSLPIDFVTNPEYDKKRIEYIQKHPNVINSISNVFRIDNNLMFKAGVWGDNEEDNLIYNLKSGSLIAYKHIQQDERSCFLPIFDKVGRNFSSQGMLACRNGYLYTSISSLGMFKARDENVEQKPKYNQVLTNYFKKGNLKDNPVILQLKLKSEL